VAHGNFVSKCELAPVQSAQGQVAANP
jgi:hypothetical protein